MIDIGYQEIFYFNNKKQTSMGSPLITNESLFNQGILRFNSQ